VHPYRSALQSIIFVFVLFAFILMQTAQASYAQSAVSEYGIVPSLATSKGLYAVGQLVEFSAFITNTNPYPVSVWGGCRATMVSTFSISRATGAVVYLWKPIGASCDYLYSITINSSQTLQLGAIGLGKNLTWDERTGAPSSSGGLVDPGEYTISADIVVAGFNPSGTSCQPSGTGCDPSVDHSFNLQISTTFQIGSLSASGSQDLSFYGYLVTTLVAASMIGIVVGLRKKRPAHGNIK